MHYRLIDRHCKNIVSQFHFADSLAGHILHGNSHLFLFLNTMSSLEENCDPDPQHLGGTTLAVPYRNIRIYHRSRV